MGTTELLLNPKTAGGLGSTPRQLLRSSRREASAPLRREGAGRELGAAGEGEETDPVLTASKRVFAGAVTWLPPHIYTPEQASPGAKHGATWVNTAPPRRCIHGHRRKRPKKQKKDKKEEKNGEKGKKRQKKKGKKGKKKPSNCLKKIFFPLACCKVGWEKR